MILLLHIVIALLSIVCSTATYINPSKILFRTSYALVGATFASGLYMVVILPAHMMQACMSGLVYLGIVSLALLAAKQKLAVKNAVK